MTYKQAIKQARKGKEVVFNNQADQLRKKEDDIREGSLVFGNSRAGGSQVFLIWFNGICISSLKTPSAVEKRLNKLFDKWSLEFS